MIKYRILIVDDEPLILSLLEKYLEQEKNFEVVTKNSATFILDETFKTNYDLLVFDILMPKVNGLDLLQYFRNKYPETKTIAISGMANEATIRQIIDLNCNTILKKPIKKLDFIAAVYSQLGL